MPDMQQTRSALTAHAIGRIDLPALPPIPERLKSIAPEFAQYEAAVNQRFTILQDKFNRLLDFLQQDE